MNKGNVIGLGVMAAASVVLVAGAGPAYEGIQEMRVKQAAGGLETTVYTGEAQGFGGAVTAEVTVAGDKIIALTLGGDGKTPEIGGAAMTALSDQILAAGTIDGVDAVSGATITSDAVLNAIRSAMGLEAPAEEAGAETEAEAEETEAEEAVEETTAVAYEGEVTVLTGEADGFGGPIQAEVTVSEDGKIVGLALTGDGETPAIGGTAMEQLAEAILEAGSADGIDAVSGATITSDGVFAAVEAAMSESGAAEGEAEEENAAEVPEEDAAAAEEGSGEALTGEADGFGGPIQAEVTVDADGKITGLTLTGNDETPAIGGAAMEQLTEAILEAGSADGIDAVSGATITSDAVFAAVNAALGQ